MNLRWIVKNDYKPLQIVFLGLTYRRGLLLPFSREGSQRAFYRLFCFITIDWFERLEVTALRFPSGHHATYSVLNAQDGAEPACANE